MEKDVFRLITSVGQRKILSSHEESNFRPSDSALRCSATEPQRLHGERSLLRSSYDTIPAYYWISNVDSVMFLDRTREMVSFELGKEIEKDVFSLVVGMGQRKKFESP